MKFLSFYEVHTKHMVCCRKRPKEEMDTLMLQTKQESSSSVTTASDFAPIRLMEVELGQPVLSVSCSNDQMGHLYQRALCLVCLHTQPIGIVELELDEGEMSAQTLAEHIWHALNMQINEHLQQDGLPEMTQLNESGLFSSALPRCLQERAKFLADAPFVSVIVPTHNRPDRAQSLLELTFGPRLPSL